MFSSVEQDAHFSVKSHILIFVINIGNFLQHTDRKIIWQKPSRVDLSRSCCRNILSGFCFASLFPFLIRGFDSAFFALMTYETVPDHREANENADDNSKK